MPVAFCETKTVNLRPQDLAALPSNSPVVMSAWLLVAVQYNLLSVWITLYTSASGKAELFF